MKRPPIVLALALAVTGLACGNSNGPVAEATPDTAPAAAAPEGTAASAPVDRGPVAARVNGEPIYKIDFEQALANYMSQNGLGPDAPEDRKKEAEKSVMDGLIGTELLYQKARAIPLEIPQADVDKRLGETKQGMGEEGLKAELSKRQMSEKDLERLIRVNMTIQKMIQETIIDTTTVTDDESKKFYDEHQAEMHEPEFVEASHILVRSSRSDPEEKKQAAREKIAGALKRARAGDDFAAIAKDLSEDMATAQRGGSLGSVHRGQVIPAFEEAVFKLEPGQISDIVETDFGFHVIKVFAKHPAGTAPFDRAKDRIAEFLKHQKSQKAIEAMVDSLRSTARIEIL